MAKRGIDISSHQGNIDLSALKSQIDFVIIRVGYGVSGSIDNKFKVENGYLVLTTNNNYICICDINKYIKLN